MSLREAFDSALARVDSWVNFATGVGSSFRRTDLKFFRRPRMSDEQLEDLFIAEPIAKRICNAIPSEALRRGINIGTGDPAVDSRITAKLDQLGINPKTSEAWTWGRCYGGGLLWIGADDGLSPSLPLQIDRIESVRFASVLTRREVYPHRWYTDPLQSNFGDVQQYRIQKSSAGGGFQTAVIHESRIIRFDGTLTPPIRKRANLGWCESELECVIDKLTQFNGVFAATGTLVQDVSQGVFGIKGLYQMMAADGQDLLKQRIQVMEMMRSVGNAILVDKDDESFTRTESTALSGLPVVLQQFMTLLAAAADMPATVLFGMSPAGMNATGESDIRNWYDRIASAQQNVLRPRLERVVQMILRAKDGPTAGVEPETWEIKFPPLWKPTPTEEATIRKTVADADAIYIDKGVATPEEIGTSRFRPEGWNAETSIEHSLRESVMAGDVAAASGTQSASTDPNAKDPAAALNGAQVTSLLSIVDQVATRQIPRDTGIQLISASFPLSIAQAQSIMGSVGTDFHTAPPPEQAAQMASLQSDHASLQKSHASLKSTLKRVLAKNKAGELVVGSPIGAGGGGDVSDQELEKVASELEPEEVADAKTRERATPETIASLKAASAASDRASDASMNAQSPAGHAAAAAAHTEASAAHREAATKPAASSSHATLAAHHASVAASHAAKAATVESKRSPEAEHATDQAHRASEAADNAHKVNSASVGKEKREAGITQAHAAAAIAHQSAHVAHEKAAGTAKSEGRTADASRHETLAAGHARQAAEHARVSTEHSGGGGQNHDPSNGQFT